MAGGRPGPMAKPDDVRQRTNDPLVEQVSIDKDALPSFVNANPEPPIANPNWHELVKDFWEAIRTDPARMWMTSGDWAALKIQMESISRDLKPQVVATVPGYKDEDTGQYIPGDVVRDIVPINGSRMAAFLKMLAMIGVTEGARRSYGMHIKLGIGTDALKGASGPAVAKGNRAALFAVPESGEED